jgi:hypothetical protein
MVSRQPPADNAARHSTWVYELKWDGWRVSGHHVARAVGNQRLAPRSAPSEVPSSRWPDQDAEQVR